MPAGSPPHKQIEEANIDAKKDAPPLAPAQENPLDKLKNPELRAIFERIQHSMEAQAVGAAQELHQAAEKLAGEPVQAWLPICPMPTDLCRVSPFFPMDKRSINSREYLEDLIITETAWGRISFTGPRLSTYDEDALMAILALLDDKFSRQENVVEGAKTYTYKGPLLPVLRLMGLTGQGADYSKVKASLQRLTVTALKLEIFKRSKNGKRTVTKSQMANILACAQWDEERQGLTVTINPFFHETYIQGSVTRIDVLRRAKLRAPVAKSLYRFMQSHRENRWQGHFLTLSAALNLDEQLPLFKKRDRIRTAIRRLTEAKLLTKGSGFKRENPDIVVLIRAKNAASPTAIKYN